MQAPYFSQLVSHKKTIEARLNKTKFASLVPGDIVCATNVQDKGAKAYFVVVATRTYGTFAALLQHEGLERVLPGIATVSAGIEVYRAFYTTEQEAEHGTVAIEMRKFFG